MSLRNSNKNSKAIKPNWTVKMLLRIHILMTIPRMLNRGKRNLKKVSNGKIKKIWRKPKGTVVKVPHIRITRQSIKIWTSASNQS